jgi:hypothetical protein
MYREQVLSTSQNILKIPFLIIERARATDGEGSARRRISKKGSGRVPLDSAFELERKSGKGGKRIDTHRVIWLPRAAQAHPSQCRKNYRFALSSVDASYSLLLFAALHLAWSQ